METKFCKDCKHLVRIEGKDPEFWRCDIAPLLLSRKHLITGDEADRIEGMGYATVNRMPAPDQCGPDARNFEPKETICPNCRMPHPADVACKPRERQDNGPRLEHGGGGQG